MSAGVERVEPLLLVAQAGMPVLLKTLSQAEFFEHVAALRYHLLVIDPDIAAPCQDINVRG